MKLELNDKRHLTAAEGWLELGDWKEANEELECITPKMRAHPFVLRVRWGIYAKAEKWEMAAEVAQGMTKMLPTNSWGWIQWAYSLHELRRTQEAKDVLLPVVDKFPNQYLIRYNLACYCSQLGELKKAFSLLKQAIDLAGEKDIRLMALDDPDLQPIWAEIGDL